MAEKNRFSTNAGINNPVQSSEFYISENDRLFGDNFATGEYLRRKQEIEKKKEKYKFRQNQLLERERKRWEKLDYEYLKKENQSMMNKERNLVGRKNNPGMAFNPLNLQYDNSVQGEILKRRDEESKYRSWLRSMNIDKHSNTGYNIINGEERTILEQRLNKDIVPDLIQKNIDQINEMKNKVVFNYNNFYTRCNPTSPEMRGGYRYDNSNMGNNYNGNINRSTATPNITNNNGGRFRAPIDLRDENNVYNNGVMRSNNLPRGNSSDNINNFTNNGYNIMNRNNFSPLPRSPAPRNIPYDINNNINGDMNKNNEFYNERNNNMGNNNMNNRMNNDFNNNINNNMNNNLNNNMNNRINNEINNNINNNLNNDLNNNINNNQFNYDRNNNVTPNVGIIDLNNMDSNIQGRMSPNNNLNNNNLRNNNNGNQINQLDNTINQKNSNIMSRTPNNNMIENAKNMGGNDYKGSVTDSNNNNIDQKGDFVGYDNQGPVQGNYGVNPYNPYARPDFYLMSK